jgi:hypothetical protein
MRLLRRGAVCTAAVTVGLLAMGAGNAFGAQVKVCKQVTAGSIDSLGSKTFTFKVSWANGSFTTYVRPGECSYPVYVPLLQPNGTQTRVTVQEVITGFYFVQSISVYGQRGTPAKSCGLDLGRPFCYPMVSFDVGPLVNAVTFTNRSGQLFG